MASTGLTPESLAEAVARDDVAAVVALFDGATDRQRSALRTQTEIDRWRDDVSATAAAAWLATAKANDVADWLSWRLDRRDDATVEAFIAVLLQRSERFLASVSKTTLKGDRGWWWHWKGLRTLVRAGVVDPLAGDDGYITAFGFAVGHDEVDYDADPTLLDREVWRLFEAPEVLRGWSAGVARIARPGLVDRDRLVDASLASLAMDRRPGDRRAMGQVAKELEFTDEELAARTDAVLGLVSGDPGTQLLALDWLGRILRTGAVDPIDAAEALRAPLAGTKKNLAVAALKLLDQIAADHPDAAVPALVVAASGFGHPQADVAARTLQVIGRRAAVPTPPDLAQELLAWVDVAPAAQRPGIAERCGIDGLPEDPPEEALVAVPAPRAPDPDAAYADARRVEPIEELDELVLVIARLLESEGTGEDYERALAGVGRLSGRRPPGWDDLVSPIRKRAHGILESDWIRSVAALHLARLSVAWTEGTVLPRPPIPAVLAEEQSAVDRLRRAPLVPKPTMGVLLFERVLDLCVPVAAGTPVSAWSEPTHRGGHLDPSVLAERVQTGRALGPADTRAALLRSGRAGGSDRLLAVTDNAWPQWFAAPGAPPDDRLLARAIDVCTKGSPTRFTYPPQTWWGLGRGPDDAIGAGIVCTRMDLAAAWAAVELGLRLKTNAVTADPGQTLELIADPVVPFDQPMATLVALSLAASPRTRAIATDVLITVIDDERVDATVLAGQLSVMQERELVVITRVVPPLLDVAAAGPVHRAVVLDVLLRMIVGVGTGAPGLHAALEGAVHLAGTSAIELPPETRAVLDRLAGRSSKAATAARSLLASAGS